jgi:adenosylcobinamide-GDP ribazoletransferase
VTRLEGTERSAQPPVAWPRRVLAEVMAAVGFLTRLPVGAVVTADPERTGAAAFGLVGAAVGAGGAMALLVLGDRAPLAAGGIAVGAMAVVSGALHLDGLADTADALAAPNTATSNRARKDPATGPAGVAAIAIVLVIDVGLLETLAGGAAGGSVVGGPILAALAWIVAAAGSRALPVLAVVLAAPSGTSSGAPARDGLGGWFAAHTGRWSALLATGSAVAVALAASVASGRPAFVLGAAGGIAIGVLLAGRLGNIRHGLDGDALGAIVEVGFGAILLVSLLAL